MKARQSREQVEVYRPIFGRLSCYSLCLVFLAGFGFVAEARGFELKSGHKAKVTGPIMSRDGDSLIVRDQRANALVVIGLTDHTRVERTKKGFKFRHPDMDVTALVPGLTVEVEGVGNDRGGLDARKIAFDPGEFGGSTASGQQISAESSVLKINSSVHQLVSSPLSGRSVAGSPTTQPVNYRVSDLGDYENVAQAGIYFASGKTILDAGARKTLDRVADIALPTQGYMIEVASYVAGTGSLQLDESLSAVRAEAVTLYLLNKKNIPMRRILTPAGSDATHPNAAATDPEGHALSCRVDVTVLVNHGPGTRRAGL
jgi:outer membrane protein OmpA-like peptidoglycan-associated protein